MRLEEYRGKRSEPGASVMVRFTVHFAGDVQGVGFRYVSVRVSALFALAGFVQNLPDGRVKLVVEGEADVLEQFVGSVRAAMAGYVEDTAIAQSGATGEFGKPRVGRLLIKY